MRLSLLVASLLIGTGCGSSIFTTEIAELHKQSRDYDGKNVTVRGKVLEASNVPIFGRRFLLEDATGHVIVVTERAVPNVGEEITITGECFQLGDTELTATLQAWMYNQMAEDANAKLEAKGEKRLQEMRSAIRESKP